MRTKAVRKTVERQARLVVKRGQNVLLQGVYLAGGAQRGAAVEPLREDRRHGALGAGGDVVNPAVNDPRKQVLQTEEVESFPIYVRFEPNNSGDNWNLARAEMSFNNELFPRWETTTFVSSTDGIWLGQRSGNVVHMRKHLDAPPS